MAPSPPVGVALVLCAVVTVAIVTNVILSFMSMTVVSTDCDDGNMCTADLINGHGACEFQPYPNTKRCTDDACYVAGATSTHCLARNGTCVADDYTECKGYCRTEGYDFWGLRPVVWDQMEVGIYPYFIDPPPWDPYSTIIVDNSFFNFCAANQKSISLLVLDYIMWFNDNQIPMLAHELSCMDFIDPAQTPDYGCLVADSSVVESTAYHNNVLNIIGETVSNDSYTGRLCTYRYRCGAFNTTQLYQTNVTMNPVVTSLGTNNNATTTTTTSIVSQAVATILSKANTTKITSFFDRMRARKRNL